MKHSQVHKMCIFTYIPLFLFTLNKLTKHTIFSKNIVSGKHNYINTQERINRFGIVTDKLYTVGLNCRFKKKKEKKVVRLGVGGRGVGGQ